MDLDKEFQKFIYQKNSLNYLKKIYSITESPFLEAESYEIVTIHKQKSGKTKHLFGYLSDDNFDLWAKRANLIFNGIAIEKFNYNHNSPLFGSSRFVFEMLANKDNASKLAKQVLEDNNIPNIKIDKIETIFEYSNKIKGIKGPPSQLDCVLSVNNEEYAICIEAKMKEIYKNATNKLSEQYFYENGPIDDVFTNMNQSVFTNKFKNCRYDIKQNICHLLGIISNFSKKKYKKIFFIYFIFDPTHINGGEIFNQGLSEYLESAKEIVESKDYIDFIESCNQKMNNCEVKFAGFYSQKLKKLD
jgi:hypothetical protein